MDMSDVMAGLAPVAQRASVSNAVSIAVAVKSLDQARAQGAAANELIRAAADVQRSTSGARAGGGRVDLYA